MLTLAKLGFGQESYYLQLAAGVQDYYVAAGESPGVWMGTSARRLGLVGTVDAEPLGHVLGGRDPSGETWLANQRVKVPGFDATFCAPKSVSLLFALGDDRVRREVGEAHDMAVAQGLRLLETVAARGRRGHGGERVVKGEGFVAAGFRHRTSRAGDPHLHTHVLIANVVRLAEDERWSALDARGLYQWARPVGFVYEAALRAELTRRLGVSWEPVRSGAADVAGIPKDVLRAFSQRRVEIEQALADRGASSARAAQVAAYATRRPKDPEATAESLVGEWHDRAEKLGFDAESLVAVLADRREPAVPEPGSPAGERMYAALTAPTGLTEAHATFSRREVVQAVCSALPDGGDVHAVVALVEGYLRSDRVALARDGDRPEAHRWTTPEMIDVERRLVDGAIARRSAGLAVVPNESVDAALSMAALDDEQEEMVRRICRSGSGVDVVVGVAGAGKTRSLVAARLAWDDAGYRVVGAALAARAAAELQAAAGIPATSLDRLLADLDHPESRGLDRRTIVVLDEAAMVGTRKLARLLDHARTANAKVVLVGDHRQLPEIQAGGAFAALARRLETSELTGNRRQTQSWERQALADLRHGRTGDAVAAYTTHDRIHTADDIHALRGQLLGQWAAARAAGRSVLMVAARHDDVEALNRLARQILRASGQLIGPELVVGGRGFAVGDQVMGLRNDYRLGILNGTRGTVQRIYGDRSALTISTEWGWMHLPAPYLQDGQLTHGYATTVHKAQGLTVDETLYLADELTSQEVAYTALSRGRQRNDLFTTLERAEESHGPTVEENVLETLNRRLGRSAAKELAIEEPDLFPEL